MQATPTDALGHSRELLHRPATLKVVFVAPEMYPAHYLSTARLVNGFALDAWAVGIITWLLYTHTVLFSIAGPLCRVYTALVVDKTMKLAEFVV
jgi:hypothetical protein